MTDVICFIDGCERPVICRGRCQPHYTSFVNSADFTYKVPLTAEQKFFARLIRTEECWEWRGVRQSQKYKEFDYGILQIKPNPWGTYYAHRISWIIHNGPIPEGMRVCHHCDNPPCVRPDHLFLGSAADNTRDMLTKDRHSRGSRVSNARLTERDVRIIRKMAAHGVTQTRLAQLSGASLSVVNSVVNRRAWKHVA